MKNCIVTDLVLFYFNKKCMLYKVFTNCVVNVLCPIKDNLSVKKRTQGLSIIKVLFPLKLEKNTYII